MEMVVTVVDINPILILATFILDFLALYSTPLDLTQLDDRRSDE